MPTVVFIVGCLGLLLAALVNWWSRLVANRRAEEVSKPLATMAAIVIAAGSGASGTLIAIAVFALVVCLIGDIALLPRLDHFLLGLGAFLIAHLAFVAMFVVAGVKHERLAVGGIAVVAVVAAVAGAPEIKGATSKGLGGPVIAYFSVIAAMAITAWPTGNWLFILGATSFVVSDSLLGWDKFVGERRWLSPVVMITYHVALFGLSAGLRLT